ncbi:MAG: electron transfer flavoprotein subunit alpha/FixB family protein, partial [Kangiellaceae bacterium]|nr:electron transfer flavoprotein subunit alpha/FixB family protein [Kangiellaceae bacterium]
MAILVIAEHNNEALGASTLATLAAAQKIGADVHVLVAGSGSQSVADAAAACEGVVKVLHADNADLEHATAESLASIVKANAEGYTHILAPASTYGKNFMPRIGALLDVQPISDIVSVEDENTFKRPIYAGNAIATVQSNDPVKVITVRGTAFDAVAATGGSAEIASVDASGNISEKSKFESQELTKSERPELTAAKVI